MAEGIKRAEKIIEKKGRLTNKEEQQWAKAHYLT